MAARTSTARADAWGKCWQRSAERWSGFGRKVVTATGWKVWNPGLTGEPWHARFRRLYPPARNPIAVFGLNPGPYGMAQTGIPFTDVKRLSAELPALAAELRSAGEAVAVPGLAPRSLRPYLTRTFESSSVRIYRFFRTTYGSSERGVREVVVANPCPLLFIDPKTGKNVTPADLTRAVNKRGVADAGKLRRQMNELRLENCVDTLHTLKPRGAILLGRDVQAAIGEALRARLEESRVLDYEHPARAVPDKWAKGLGAALRERGLLEEED